MSEHILDPALKRWATPLQAKYIDAVNEHGSYRKAAAALGLAKDSVRQCLENVHKRAAAQGYAPEHNMIQTVPDPFKVRGVSTFYGRDGEVRGQWVKSQIDNDKTLDVIREYVENLVDSVKGLSPLIAAPQHANEDLLSVYPMGDPHYGMYAWKDESGADFDLDIAEGLTRGAIDSLIASSPPSATALLLNLGDFFHMDSGSNETTRGTNVDVDTRWGKVMQVGLRSMNYCVARLIEKHQTVIVRNVAGNHDRHSSFALALAMQGQWSNNPRVTVDLTPAEHWYFRFGKVLLGATHGDTTKINNLLGVMANDRAVDWGQTSYRHWYCGHIHHQKVQEFPGVIVEYFRTLAARDAWHAGQGYRAGRDMTCIVHHRLYGEVGRHRCDIAMIER